MVAQILGLLYFYTPQLKDQTIASSYWIICLSICLPVILLPLLSKYQGINAMNLVSHF